MYYDNSNGNVGIGTINPLSALHVIGTIKATLFSGDGGQLTNITPAPDDDWNVSGEDIYRETGNVGIGTNAPLFPLDFGSTLGKKLALWQGMGATNPGFFGFGIGMSPVDTADTLEFYANWDVSIPNMEPNMVIDAEEGNVGIGTTDPNAKLDVYGNIAINGDEIIDETGKWVGSPLGLFTPYQWNGPRLRFMNSDGTWGDYENLKGERGPQGPKGDKGDKGDTGDTGPQGIPGPVAGSDKQFIYNNSGSADGADMYYDNSNGRVGIGTTSPGAKLEIDQGSGAILADFGSSSYGVSIKTKVGPGSGWARGYNFRDSNGAELAGFGALGVGNSLIYAFIGTGPSDWDSPWVVFKPDGNVGIGTTDPGAELDVNGTIKWGVANLLRTNQGGSIELGNSLSAGKTPYIDFHYGVGVPEDYNVRIINHADGKLMLSASTIYADGNVGIGTNNPDATLEVKGTMKILGDRDDIVDFDVVYLATTDGFVEAWTEWIGSPTADCKLKGFTDENVSPITLRAGAWSGKNSQIGSFSMPVRKGDYWKVTLDPSDTGCDYGLSWLPLGT